MSTFCFLIFIFLENKQKSVFRNCLIFYWFTTNPYKSNSPERIGSMSFMFWRNLSREGKACFLSHRHTMQLKLLNLRRPFCFSSSYVACVRTVYFPPLLFRAPSSSYFPQNCPLFSPNYCILAFIFISYFGCVATVCIFVINSIFM